MDLDLYSFHLYPGWSSIGPEIQTITYLIN